MLERIKRALDAGRRAAAEADLSAVEPVPEGRSESLLLSQPQPPFEPAPDVDAPEPEPLHALLVLDEVGSAADEVTRRCIADAKVAGTKALFVLSSNSDLDFPDCNLLCEFLPTHEEIFRATEERADVIDLYRQHRLRLILDKWRVRECRWIGESAADLVAKLNANKDSAKRPVVFRKF